MQDNVSNKQFFAVMMFLGLIIVTITILASSSCEDKKLTNGNKSNGDNIQEEVDGSESVEVIVSNSNSNQVIEPDYSNSNNNPTTSKTITT